MIYLCTALIWEAKPFITTLSLKQNQALNRFPIYENDEFSLIITGSGPLNAAIGLTYLLSSKNIHSNDLIINVGICGSTLSSLPIGTAHMIHKIKDHSTNMTYYPDILFTHPFPESSIETSAQIVNNENRPDFSEALIDMEAAAIYRTSSFFIQPHQVQFFKIVSDYLSSDRLTAEDVSGFILPYVEQLCSLAREIVVALPKDESPFTQEEIRLIEQFKEQLHLSVSMQTKLDQVLLYCKNNGQSVNSLINTFYASHDISEIKLKKEGKKYFELFISGTI